MKSVDRITEALERAQRSGHSAAPIELLKPAFTPHSPINGASTQRAVRQTVIYSKTRVVNVPQEQLAANHIAAAGVQTEQSEAMAAVVAQLAPTLVERNWRTIGVVSPGESDIRTRTAINLGIALTTATERTCLLVDANLRKPGVTRLLGMDLQNGLSDYLQGHAPLDGMFVSPGIDGLVILPAGRPQTNSGQLLASTRMAAMVAELKTRYRDRIVLFDLPPALTAVDVMEFAPYADALLLVGGEGPTAQQELGRARMLLEKFNLAGVIVNEQRAPAPVPQPEPSRPGLFSRIFKRS